jgi:hypothetical protein
MPCINGISAFGFIRPIRGEFAHEFGRGGPEQIELILVDGGCFA